MAKRKSKPKSKRKSKTSTVKFPKRKPSLPAAQDPNRDEKGRLIKGHESMGGRKPRVTEAEYYQIFKDAASPTKFAEMVVAMVNKATNGDVSAFNALCKYALPTPEQRILLESRSIEQFRVAGLTSVEMNKQAITIIKMKIREHQEQESLRLEHEASQDEQDEKE